MMWVFLRPTTSLLFCDGRSFATTNRGETMSWPMPQQLLGALRTRIGTAQGFDWDFRRIDPALEQLIGSPAAVGRLSILGPFYARRDERGTVEPLLPRPADLVAFPRGERRTATDGGRYPPRLDVCLRPACYPSGVQVAPPMGLDAALAPLDYDRTALAEAVGDAIGAKPLPGHRVPAFISLSELRRWLYCAAATAVEGGPREDRPGPFLDDRVRVTMHPETWTGDDGLLFSVRRLTMPVERRDDNVVRADYGMLLQIPDADGLRAEDVRGPWRLGGKAGLVDAELVVGADTGLKRLRDEMDERLRGTNRFRWILATPARFSGGWLPSWIGRDGRGTFPGTDVLVQLEAAAVERPVAYSGWDLQAGDGAKRAGGGARPTRLFVPAGAVYFFRVLAPGPDGAAPVARAAWLRPVADAASPDSDRATDLDAHCGLAAGLFAPWDYFDRAQEGEPR